MAASHEAAPACRVGSVCRLAPQPAIVVSAVEASSRWYQRPLRPSVGKTGQRGSLAGPICSVQCSVTEICQGGSHSGPRRAASIAAEVGAAEGLCSIAGGLLLALFAFVRLCVERPVIVDRVGRVGATALNLLISAAVLGLFGSGFRNGICASSAGRPSGRSSVQRSAPMG
jgi:hypothetical protein